MKIPCQELATYLNRPIEIVTERCKYSPFELAWKWPEYKDRTLDFYKENDLYLFDLTYYHDLIMPHRGTHEWFKDIIKRYDIKTVLDYGGGIGEYTILATEAGAKCDYLDVDGESKKYAQWRFDRRNIKPNMLNETAEDFGSYDLITIMDTLEHIPDPVPIIKKLSEKAKYIICNPEEIPYNWVYPCHISRFDLTPYFTKIENYLWKNHSGALS